MMPGKKIVVVDDDERIRKTFFLILNKKYRVYLAQDSQETLARFKKASVDLVIADYKLPGLGGIDLIRDLREAGYKGAAILISAFPDLVRADDLQRLSISHFFVKPLDLKAFTQVIDDLLETKDAIEKRA